MTRAIYTLIFAAGIPLLASDLAAQASAEPFKLGTFDSGGHTFVGAVLGDSLVIDLPAANAHLERQAGWVTLPMAQDMRELIGRYAFDGLRQRIYGIVNEVNSRTRAGENLGYIHDVASLDILPPLDNPETMLNAAVNYRAHAEEMRNRAGSAPAAAPTDPSRSMPGIWERAADDDRQNPYLFLKPRTAIIGHGDAIRMPPGRERLDWECELAVVIGRRASHVSVDDAGEYIFGYTIETDVSDRGGRGDRRHGSDWLVGKGHDTYAPLGPFIVPKEFVGDPMNLAIKFTLNDQVMQDSNTGYMWHNVYELVHYASNILTLRPGDVISTGSPSGVGAGRNPPVFMKKGDTAVSWIEGIGTLTNPVR